MLALKTLVMNLRLPDLLDWGASQAWSPEQPT